MRTLKKHNQVLWLTHSHKGILKGKVSEDTSKYVYKLLIY